MKAKKRKKRPGLLRVLWRRWTAKLVLHWERAFRFGGYARDLGHVSREKQYDLNAAAIRNRWHDRKGNVWPLRDAL